MISHEVVVVTGASAGVGRAVARRFAEDGAAIGLGGLLGAAALTGVTGGVAGLLRAR